MGLLEDAIREHLELKRLRGADPAEVAREQRDALDVPPGGEPAAVSGHDPQPGEDGAEIADYVPAGDDAASAEPPAEAVQAADGSELPSVVQETAELDMQAVLDDEPATVGDGSSVSEEEDSLEWEVPAASTRGAGADSGSREDGERDGEPEPAGARQEPDRSPETSEEGWSDSEEQEHARGRPSR